MIFAADQLYDPRVNPLHVVDWSSASLRPAADSNRRSLVPLLKRRHKLEFGLRILLWMGTLILFWAWWLQPEHNIGTARYLICSFVLAWTSLCPLYFLTIFYRARIPNRTSPVPSNYRVAMVVTKAPSEPFPVVRRTLEAMLQQTYPHDTWLADEDPSEQTIEWCKAHGVRISTRKGRPDYHRKTWPRRTRCKEGNLAFFYDYYGYENYDFVSQLDADHVPSPSYLEEMLRPFADARIGYVSAPSICDNNAPQSWAARSRLYHEGGFHGPLQAGYNGGLAPMCIGSHYAVRTAALKEIGGLGPELAEDHSTSLFMNAHGWRGVHALDAIAHGDGPNTFADMVTQEFQWSRSLVMLLLQYTPGLLKGLPFRLKFQFLFCQLWYPLLSLATLTAFLIAPVALIFDINMAGVTYPEFVLYGIGPELVLTFLMLSISREGWMRPADAKVISWEGTLYLLARWPWILLGTLAAVRDWWTGTTVDFQVTPKGTGSADPLPLRIIMPYVLLSVSSGLPALVFGNIQTALGFYIIALMNSVFYTVLTVAILVKHVEENGRGSSRIDAGDLLRISILALVIGIPCAAIPLRFEGGIAAVLLGSEKLVIWDLVHHWIIRPEPDGSSKPQEPSRPRLEPSSPPIATFDVHSPTEEAIATLHDRSHNHSFESLEENSRQAAFPNRDSAQDRQSNPPAGPQALEEVLSDYTQQKLALERLSTERLLARARLRERASTELMKALRLRTQPSERPSHDGSQTYP
jgi:cellulose synthase/poly-beta-1,6-N-acetylglucosamine synthase-like glycosyltransferase